MKIIKYEDIKTPETVKEFRTNMKKYFVCIKEDREQLYVHTDKGTKEVDVNTLESLTSLYSKFDCGSIKICPTISFDVKDVTTDEVLINMVGRDFTRVLKDDSRFIIYEMQNKEDVMEFMERKKPCWYGIDNQILRAFYSKTLGKFSGYVINENTKIKVDKDIPIPPKRSLLESESA